MIQFETDVTDLIQKVLHLMEHQQYSKNAIRKHRSIIKQLVVFSKQNYGGKYSVEIGAAFIDEVSRRQPPLSLEYFRAFKSEVRRLDHVLLRMPEHYAFGDIGQFDHSCFDSFTNAYNKYIRGILKSALDVRIRTRALARFFKWLELHGITSLQDLQPQHIHNVYIDASDKDLFRKTVRGFFRYAYSHKLLKRDFSVAVPSFRRHIPVPSVYSTEEVERLLSSVDRNTKYGKRNYAILILIARLGIRSSDIVNLRFENLNFTANVIEITQVKTSEHLTLPITDEIRNAILDYTHHGGRSDHNSDYLFLSYDAPIRLLGDRAIYLIVSRAFTTAGVQIDGRKHGPHALRASLATALLNEGYSYPVITEVLGHKDPNTAQHYVKVDITHLRECAMQVPPPSGMFYKYLCGEEDVI
ncbi:tyrosine-type recombinase/integrase [Clostridium sp. CF011]|uniref:tyrosine-type recombinase/integrase n=1 Tax=Clostridium sp. CF011 TaxID=2843318 RepID=UPI001C0ACB11|nr:tyrosine-type recombinase/integrase [Clostridium sp. CF011]MBU3093377.1 tyrosine-type recombinase/integrase [Clostridium sp. CF011]WAG70572.1 tyrosine-type recombinase/integrase [Clostridium sp. CF011]